jgi:hypothetical protein
MKINKSTITVSIPNYKYNRYDNKPSEVYAESLQILLDGYNQYGRNIPQDEEYQKYQK